MTRSILAQQNEIVRKRKRAIHRRLHLICLDCGSTAVTKQTVKMTLCAPCWQARRECQKRRNAELNARGLCSKCKDSLDGNQTHCPRCVTRIVNAARKRRKLTKVFIVGHFGGKCQDCGELDIRTLTLDHVNGDGAEHRRRLSGGTSRVWRDVEVAIRANRPPPYEFRLLCMNCHAKKTFGEWSTT